MSINREKLACRPDQLFGRWAMQPDVLSSLEDRAIAEIEAGRLTQISAASKDTNEEKAASPYTIENGIARISVDGPITKYPTSFASMFGGTSTVQTQAAIREASENPKVKGILLDINSPGGTVLGVAELSDTIQKIDQSVPVYAHINGLGASAAYWIASHARVVSADPTAEVGSIGAFTTLTDRSENLAKQGIEKILFASGEAKGAGADGVKPTKIHKQAIQERIDATGDTFVRHVAAARNLPIEHVRKVADGRVYPAQKAKDLKLIDDVSYADDFMSKISGKDFVPPPARKQAPSPGTTQPRAEGVSSMTAEQLAKVRALPGGASVSDDQAADWLIGQVSASVSEKTAHQTAIQAKDTMIQSRDAQITELKTKLPAVVDPAMAAERIELAIERNQLLVDQGLCSPAQHKLIVDSLKPGGTANVSAVQPGGVVAVPAKVLHDTFSLNKPFAFGSQTPSQALNRHVPGAQASDDKDAAKKQGEAEGKAFHDKQLAARGLK